MRYRVTCLTPTLVGDGQRLAPIDYMVWRDQVNVLDQNRIFRLLAKGPRLEGYLGQLKKADKLDFASWGGFAQNYSERRIPFEHSSSTPHWERGRAENLFIPTFATGPRGPYLPATALKGALRTGAVHGRATEELLKQTAAKIGNEGRGFRQAAQQLEDATLGGNGADEMRHVAIADSNPVAENVFKIYLLRVSTLEARGPRQELGWKTAPRGSSKRPEESTPMFAEMAPPGTTFEGIWSENEFLKRPEIARALRRRDRLDTPALFTLVNQYAGDIIKLHRRYAETTGLAILRAGMDALEQRLAAMQESGSGCMLLLGWGAGFFSKAAFSDTENAEYRNILRQLPFYSRAIQSGLPFPKTRKIVFLGGQPATVPGFVQLEVG
ncbi:MAG TPA: RAMP superfamily CRISPR-associated protein [Bryobacteraceae bacterium]|nr:RAMP superfamily CRISPR-associated protein [Bryobacteraceae bacterium]